MGGGGPPGPPRAPPWVSLPGRLRPAPSHGRPLCVCVSSSSLQGRHSQWTRACPAASFPLHRVFKILSPNPVTLRSWRRGFSTRILGGPDSARKCLLRVCSRLVMEVAGRHLHGLPCPQRECCLPRHLALPWRPRWAGLGWPPPFLLQLWPCGWGVWFYRQPIKCKVYEVIFHDPIIHSAFMSWHS